MIWHTGGAFDRGRQIWTPKGKVSQTQQYKKSTVAHAQYRRCINTACCRKHPWPLHPRLPEHCFHGNRESLQSWQVSPGSKITLRWECLISGLNLNYRLSQLNDGSTEWLLTLLWYRTGKPGMLQSTGSQKVGHKWATELNWWCKSGIRFSRNRILNADLFSGLAIIFCDTGHRQGPQLPVSHVIMRVSNWYHSSVPIRPFCFSFLILYPINYMIFNTSIK